MRRVGHCQGASLRGVMSLGRVESLVGHWRSVTTTVTMCRGVTTAVAMGAPWGVSGRGRVLGPGW